MNKNEFTRLADELVTAWHEEEVMVSDRNPFGPPRQNSLDRCIDKLRNMQLCDGPFKLRDLVHGSPILLCGGNEITFAKLKLARAVKNVLEISNKPRYIGVEILKTMK